MKGLLLFIFYFSLSFTTLAGNDSIRKVHPYINLRDSSEIMHRRTTTIEIAGGAVYLGTLLALYNIKYKDNLQSRFKINTVKDDWRMGMDANHHTIGSYYIGRMSYKLLRWAGTSEQRAAWIGGLSGFSCSPHRRFLMVLTPNGVRQPVTWHLMHWAPHSLSVSNLYGTIKR
ncbi:MAG: hypothetical protein WCM93_07890 [Bacteroidota bacterium]